MIHYWQEFLSPSSAVTEQIEPLRTPILLIIRQLHELIKDSAVWELFCVSQLSLNKMSGVFTSLQLLNCFHAEVSNVKIKNYKQTKNTLLGTLMKQQ